MKNINFRQLKAYQAIVGTGSATAAAKILALTQPAVSRALATLEADLGFQLFERRGRNLVHSEKGRQFFRTIEPILNGLDALPGIVEDIKLERGNLLRISAIGPLLFSELVPQALKQFQSFYPDLRLEVSWVDRLDIEDWIANQNSEIGLTLMPVDHPLLEAREFTSVSAVALLPSSHRLAEKSEIGPSDLRNERLVIPARKTRLRQLADKCMLEAKHPLPIMIETSSAIASCHLVAAGLGIGISDPFSATGIRQGNFVVRSWKPTIKMAYAAVWLKSRPLSVRTSRLVEILHHLAGQMKNSE
ncbi:MAG: LysR family transcriptional regulator [Albidovulum sp.]|nr:LysR family transcriptional regulator [Albidovulum sp.]